MKFIDHKIPLLLAAVWLCHCNLEVGNPEPVAPDGMRSVQNLGLNIASRTPCELTKGDCTAAPVSISNNQNTGMTYEMTSVKFQMSGVELKPVYAESILTNVNVLKGATIELAKPVDSTLLNGIALRFDRINQLAPALWLEGSLVVRDDCNRTVVPLNLEMQESILAEMAIPLGTAGIEGVLFDVNAWFDFRGAPADVIRAIEEVAHGACRNSTSPACAQYRERIARTISQKISKSLSLKTKPAGTVTSGKLGGKSE